MDVNWKKIEHYIHKIQRRLAFNSLLDGLLKGLALGSGAAFLISVAAFIFPWYEFPWFMLGAVALGLAAGITWGLIRMPGMKEAALVGDSAGLNEALITALERKDQNDALSFMQRKATAQRLEHFAPKKAVKLCFPWKTGLFFTALAAMCIGQFFIPAPARSQALAKHEAVSALAEKKDLIEAVKNEVASDTALDPDQKEQLTSLLAEAQEEMAQAESVMDKNYEDAMNRLDMKLAKAADGSSDDSVADSVMSVSMKMDLPSAREANACAQSLKEGLKNLKDKNGDALGDTMDEEAIDQMASDMARKQALGQLSRDALDQLALASDVDVTSLKNIMDDTMGQLAAQNMDIKKLSGSSDGNGNNSDSAGDSGDNNGSSTNGDGAGSSDGSASGIASGNNAGAQVAGNENNTGNGGANSSSNANSSSGAGNNGNSGAGNSGGSGSGAGNGSSGSSGSNIGSGSGASQGSNGSGSGAGSGGSGSGSGQGGSGGSGTGSGWNYGSKQGFEKEDSGSAAREVLNLPDYKLGDDSNLQGTKSNGNKTVQMTNSALTYAGQSVGYDQVIGDYSDNAYRQIEQAQIPDGMKDLVKDYFSALNQ